VNGTVSRTNPRRLQERVEIAYLVRREARETGARHDRHRSERSTVIPAPPTPNRISEGSDLHAAVREAPVSEPPLAGPTAVPPRPPCMNRVLHDPTICTTGRADIPD